MTLEDSLHTVSPQVVEVPTYYIHQGVTLAIATAQLWLGNYLTVVESGFLGETS